MERIVIARIEDLPQDPDWLGTQPFPVVAYGPTGETPAADVVVPDDEAARTIEQRIRTWPDAALLLVQVLRSTSALPCAQALDIESMAYATLQGGPEFARWKKSRGIAATPPPRAGEPIVLERDHGSVRAVLNRPETRNAMSVEMRDAWVEALQLLEADDSVQEMHISGSGDCFSVGGELNEFGQAPDPATAHWIRTVHSPARLLARNAGRLRFYLHGACIGSGIELPAFASRVIAHSRSFFQLPELQFGLIPGAGGTVSIARRIGRQRLAWMVLTGKRINARTALEWGLVDEILDWR